MRKTITAATLLAALLALTACGSLDIGGNPKFLRATYLASPYEYDPDTQLPILQARDDDPGRHFANPFRGREWR